MRVLALAALAGLLVAVISDGAGGAERAGPVAGDSVAVLWRYTDPEGVVVAWVLRADHLVTCETAASELRELRRRFGTRIRLAIVSEEGEKETVIAFLHKQRLADPQLQLLDPQEFAGSFGRLPSPRMYIMRAGRVTAALSADNQTLKDGAFRDALSAAVRQALSHPPGPAPPEIPHHRSRKQPS